jgi:hypothetical protein
MSNALKLLSLFRSKNLLCTPQYFLLKEALLSSDEVLEILDGYDLHALSDNSNINHLMSLFDKLEMVGNRYAQILLNSLFDEDTLTQAHQIANAKSVKFGDTTNKKAEGRNFVYGEIEYDSFTTVLGIAMVGMKRKHKFVDLGSGLGKACLWVALTTNFEHILGIEVIEGLVEQSRGILQAFDKALEAQDYRAGADTLELIQGSFLSDEYVPLYTISTISTITTTSPFLCISISSFPLFASSHDMTSLTFLPSLPFPSLPFPSLPFPSLPFPSLDHHPTAPPPPNIGTTGRKLI